MQYVAKNIFCGCTPKVDFGCMVMLDTVMFDQKRFNELLTAYLNGNITEEERSMLFTMGASSHADPLLEAAMDRDIADQLLPRGEIAPAEADRMIRNIIDSEENTIQLFKKTQRRKYFRMAAVAAAVVVIFLSWTYLFTGPSMPADTREFMAMIPEGNAYKINNSKHPLEVRLEDGSLVRLEPNSSISYPKRFSDEREVYLTGEAFFDVAKDPSRPFLVYYNNIVTRVLGTSFTIKTNAKTNNVEVSVRTGKVQVTENSRIRKGEAKGEALKGVILKPNQKTVYNVAMRNFEITLADSIYRLIDPETLAMPKIEYMTQAFKYDKPTTLADIFSQLESLYGIEIVVTNENIYQCVFTGDISSQEMLKKVQILCLTIGAEFEVNGARILVSGKGCHS